MVNNKVKKTAKWLLALFNQIDKALSNRKREELIVNELPKAIVNTINICRERAVNVNQFRENLLDSLYHYNDYIYKEFIRPDVTGATAVKARFDIDEFEDENHTTTSVRVVYGYGAIGRSYTIDIPRAFKEENYRG